MPIATWCFSYFFFGMNLKKTEFSRGQEKLFGRKII